MSADGEFNDFWKASELDRFTIGDFGRRMSSYSSENIAQRLEWPESATPLATPKSSLSKIAKKRTSVRSFSDDVLRNKDIATIFSAFYAHDGLEHRSYPAAGAIYTVEIFLVIFKRESCDGAILYYDPKAHGYVKLPGAIPLWADAEEMLNIDVIGAPQSLVLFVTFPERIMDKYSERGGRFLLLETGAAMQQLALTIAESKVLKGVPVGGTMDRYWLKVLGLLHTDARIALGYLVGR